MSFQAMTWASKQKMPAAKKSLLYTLANYCGHDGTLWPSYRTLAEDSGLSKRSVIKYMAEFEAAGLIGKVYRNKKSGDNDSNLWVIHAVKGGAGDSLPSEPDSPPSAGDSPHVVNEIHQGGERAAPKPVSEPVSKPVREPAKKSAPRKKTPTLLPEDFTVTEQMRKWFSEQGFSIDLDRATERWLDAMAAKGFTYADWTAAWRMGMKKAQEWASQDSRQQSNISQFPQNRPRKAFPGISQAPTGTGGHR